MSAGDRDTLTALIRRHEFWAGLGSCSCGYDCEPFDDGHEGEERAHRTHLADVLLAADWLAEREAAAEQRGREDNADHGMCYVHGSKALAEVKAGAWDEGHLDVCNDCVCRNRNPYRTTENTTTEEG